MRRRTEDSPAKQEWEEDAKRGVSEEGEGPNEGVFCVIVGALRIGEFEGEPQENGREESGKRSIPNPSIGDDDAGGAGGPEPGSEDGRGWASNASSGGVEGDAGERGKDGVEDDGGVERSEGKDSEDFEDRGKDQGIDRRDPRSGPSGLAEDTAEAVALGEGGGDVAYFIFERSGGENLVRNKVGSIGEVENSKEKSDSGNKPGRGKKAEEFFAHPGIRIAPMKGKMGKSLSRG